MLNLMIEKRFCECGQILFLVTFYVSYLADDTFCQVNIFINYDVNPVYKNPKFIRSLLMAAQTYGCCN